MIPENKPRIGENAEKVGAYEQCIKLITPVIYPGDIVRIEQYFTGYGEISGAKIAFYPSSEIFESVNSHIVNGIKKENDKLLYGASSHPFLDVGVIIAMNGIKNSAWIDDTQFFDISNKPLPAIFTETKQGEAPFKYVLKTDKKIKPGPYYLEFVFTYFNGEKWVSTTKKIEFKVQNFLERHAFSIGLLATLASLSALIRFAFIPVFNFVFELYSMYGK